ncbi:MAG TPA: PQQ-dependent sugar dehydrogenase [Anaerolineae bacterium]|nr:PQQ-dependent sugar dehydrogenase [Anaerolineae bacterium]
MERLLRAEGADSAPRWILGGVVSLTMLVLAVSLWLWISSQAWTGYGGGDEPIEMNLVPVGTGLNMPLGATHTGLAGDKRLFVMEKQGRIQILDLNTPDINDAQLFLDISDRVAGAGSEDGLLGLAFHPNYGMNGYFYVSYTTFESNQLYSYVSRFEVTSDPNVADPDSEERIIRIWQPYEHHNGGNIMFGPDDYLYIGMGDGGSVGDPSNWSQNRRSLLGKMLRIDVDRSGGNGPDCDPSANLAYSIPNDNPFVNEEDENTTCDEIWAIGLRNPWRFSFDRGTGDMFIGDVGQLAWEEIDYVPAGSPGGQNFGWRCYEGNFPYNTTGCGPREEYDGPIYIYSHADGRCAITGGYVYRGTEAPTLLGRYLFSDFCTGRVWSVRPNGTNWEIVQIADFADVSFVSFGEDSDGELYMVDINGTVYKVTATGPLPTPTVVTLPPDITPLNEYLPAVLKD